MSQTMSSFRRFFGSNRAVIALGVMALFAVLAPELWAQDGGEAPAEETDIEAIPEEALEETLEEIPTEETVQ